MSRHRWPNPPDLVDAGSISRAQAAQLLKLARSEGGDVVTEAIDWAYAAMPERAIVQRLKARSLMQTGYFEAADAVIAQALLLYPTDPVLSVLRAERLLAKGQLESAAREVNLVLANHPRRPTALALGATIAMKRCDYETAVQLFERAVEARPLDQALRLQLIEALLAGEKHVQAARQFASLTNPPALLEARVLKAQGRHIDALTRLEDEWAGELEGEHADEVAAAIVETLETIGQLERLEQFVSELTTAHPRAIARAAETYLILGRFEDAMRLGGQLLRRRAFVPIGRGILLVAATMHGNFGVAQRAARQLVTSELTIDRISLAELWRRGMIGKLICRNTSLATVENSARHSTLATLAQSAADQFRELLAEAEAAGNTAEAAELLAQIRLCHGSSVPGPASAEDSGQNEAPKADAAPAAVRRAA